MTKMADGHTAALNEWHRQMEVTYEKQEAHYESVSKMRAERIKYLKSHPHIVNAAIRQYFFDHDVDCEEILLNLLSPKYDGSPEGDLEQVRNSILLRVVADEYPL